MSEESGVTAVEAGMLKENFADPVAEAVKPDAPAEAEPSPPAPKADLPPEPPQPAETPAEAAVTDKTDWMNMFKKIKNGLTDPTVISLAAIAISLLIGVSQLFLLVRLVTAQKQVELLEKGLEAAKNELLAQNQAHEKRFSSDLQEKELNEKEARKQAVIFETLNRIRNGQPEVRLRRRNAGDWRVIDKNEAVVSTPELIEYLNIAMTKAKSSRSLKPDKQQLPPHSEDPVCLLHPDGKGGTMVSFAPDFIVGPKSSK